jgi:hypothetical protein
MKRLFILLFLFIGITLSAQNKQNSENNFNTPPNAVLLPKAAKSVDFFEKVNNQPDYSKVSQVESDFRRFLSKDDLNDMEINDKASYQYYVEALNFFEMLSPKVKALFTADDLWNIYMFHSDFKNQLLNIK